MSALKEPFLTSAFVGFDTVSKTLSTLRIDETTPAVIDLKKDIGAGDAYKVIKLMRQLAETRDPEVLSDIALYFIDGWNLVAPDGDLAPISKASFDQMHVKVRAEIDLLVELHVAAWYAEINGLNPKSPDESEGDSDNPLTEPAQTTTGSASTASRSRSTKRRTS